MTFYAQPQQRSGQGSISTRSHQPHTLDSVQQLCLSSPGTRRNLAPAYSPTLPPAAMAPPAPARVPATPRTTRSKANTSGSSSGVGLGAPSTSASASTSTPSIALHPGTPGNPGNVGARSESRIPMTTGKMGLLGKKPSRLFHLKEREEGVKEVGVAIGRGYRKSCGLIRVIGGQSPVARRLASFTHNMTSKARGASGASSNTVPASDGAPPTTHMPSHLPIVRPPTTHETVQAFLRLRPSPSSTGAGANAGHSAPYIEIQGDKQVVMQSPAVRPPPIPLIRTPAIPADHAPSRPQDPTRAHTPRATATYSFDRVFAPAAPQADVFTTTTLPMVEQVLHGRGGLLFSYGVSNSGKTCVVTDWRSAAGRTDADGVADCRYTMQGDIHPGAEQEKRGMIPRAIQVVFDSIEGLDCAVPVRAVGGAGYVAAAVLTSGDASRRSSRSRRRGSSSGRMRASKRSWVPGCRG